MLLHEIQDKLQVLAYLGILYERSSQFQLEQCWMAALVLHFLYRIYRR